MSSTQPTTNGTHPLSPIIKGDTDTTTVQSVTSGNDKHSKLSGF